MLHLSNGDYHKSKPNLLTTCQKNTFADSLSFMAGTQAGHFATAYVNAMTAMVSSSSFDLSWDGSCLDGAFTHSGDSITYY